MGEIYSAKINALVEKDGVVYLSMDAAARTRQTLLTWSFLLKSHRRITPLDGPPLPCDCCAMPNGAAFPALNPRDWEPAASSHLSALAKTYSRTVRPPGNLEAGSR